jgi:hypothetical protein
MATFPYSYRRVLIGKDAGGAIADIRTTGTTADLTANQIGLFDSKTYTALAPGATFTTNREVILAQGSAHTVDTLALGHGGLKDSVKSRPIDGRFITSFRKVSPKTAAQHIVAIGYDGVDNTKDMAMDCGKTYTLRITVKGSPVNRFLNHDLYVDFYMNTAACDECADGCDTAVAFLDREALIDDMIVEINAHSQLKHFVLAEKLDDGSVIGIKLTGAYVDTTFGNCSFSPFDHVELDIVDIGISQVVNDPMTTGEVPSGTTAAGWEVTELQERVFPSGLGETVLRELITFLGYRKEDYFCDPRMRETQNLNQVTTDIVDRTAKYVIYYLTYNVPYFNNKTNLYNNEEHEVMIAFKSTLDTSTFESLINQYIESNGILLTGV